MSQSIGAGNRSITHFTVRFPRILNSKLEDQRTQIHAGARLRHWEVSAHVIISYLHTSLRYLESSWPPSLHTDAKFLKLSGKIFPKLFFSSSNSLIKQNGKKHSKKVNFNFTFEPIWAELQAQFKSCLHDGRRQYIPCFRSNKKSLLPLLSKNGLCCLSVSHQKRTLSKNGLVQCY